MHIENLINKVFILNKSIIFMFLYSENATIHKGDVLNN